MSSVSVRLDQFLQIVWSVNIYFALKTARFRKLHQFFEHPVG